MPRPAVLRAYAPKFHDIRQPGNRPTCLGGFCLRRPPNSGLHNSPMNRSPKEYMNLKFSQKIAILLLSTLGVSANAAEEDEFLRSLEATARGIVNGYLDESQDINSSPPFSYFICKKTVCSQNSKWPYGFNINTTELALDLQTSAEEPFKTHRLQFYQSYKQSMKVSERLTKDGIFWQWEKTLTPLSLHGYDPCAYLKYENKTRGVIAIISFHGNNCNNENSKPIEIHDIQLNIYKDFRPGRWPTIP